MQTYKISDDKLFGEWANSAKFLEKIIDLISPIDINDFDNPKQIQELIDTNNRIISFKKSDYGKFQSLKLNENMSYRFNPFVRLQHCNRLVAKYYKILPKIIEESPNSSFHFLTMNIPHCEISDLKQNLKHLGSSLTKFLKLPEIARLLKNGGYYAVFETSLHDGMFVPHIHIVLNFPPRFKNGANYLTPEKFQKLWIDVVKFPNATAHITEIKPNDTQSLIDGAVARIKYVNKLSKLEFLTKHKDFTFEFLNQTSDAILERSRGTLAYKKIKLDAAKNVEQNYELASVDFKNDEVFYY